MRTKHNRQANRRARRKERGAALLMTLLIATLVFAAGGALILSTAVTGTNSYDATTEKQAYYAAEAGLQMSLNALRGNRPPEAGEVPNDTLMNFRTAITPSLSNGTGRYANDNPCVDATPNVPSPCHLQGWLPYTYPQGTDPYVQVGPDTGFRASVYDPDKSSRVTYSTSGQFLSLNAALGTIISPTTIRLGVAPDYVYINYVPVASTTVNNAYPSATVDLGSFRVTKTSALAALPLDLSSFVNFRLTVNQTVPWSASTTFKLTLGTPNVLSCPLHYFHINVPQPGMKFEGTTITITGLNAGQLLVGCVAAANAVTTQQVQGTIVAPEPRRLVIRSVGFGPRFARKQLELAVQRADLSFEAPATLTIRGADNCDPIVFDSGSSGAKSYSGHDHTTGGPAEDDRPAFAVKYCSLTSTNDGLKKPDTVDDPKIGVLDNHPAVVAPYIPVDMPWFLETADNARRYLNELETIARAQGRYFAPASGMTSNSGTANSPVLTFVDGDCTLDGGAGFLVVTGTLTMSGNPNFDGVVLVMGNGRVERNGGGSGTYNGAMVVAKFARTWPADENNIAHPFLTPIFNTNGGGNSDFQYNSASVSRALNVLGSRVAGVLEF